MYLITTESTANLHGTVDGTAKHTSWIMTANITISLFPWRMDAMVK